MAYARYTGDVNLIEVSEDYMRTAEETRYSLVSTVGLLIAYFNPVKIKIVGETRSGGFQSELLFYADPPYEFDKIGELIINIIKKYAETKMLGYLKMDGVVKSIREPYKRFFVQIHPLRHIYRDRIVMETTHHFTTWYIKPLAPTSILRGLFTVIKDAVPPPYKDEKHIMVRDCTETEPCDIDGHVLFGYWGRFYIYSRVPPPAGIRRIRDYFGSYLRLVPACKCVEIENELWGTREKIYCYVDDKLKNYISMVT